MEWDMRKVTDEELQEIHQLRNSIAEIVSTIGELSLEKFMTETKLLEIQSGIRDEESKFLEFQQNERVLFDKLQEKYNTGNINIETGEIVE